MMRGYQNPIKTALPLLVLAAAFSQSVGGYRDLPALPGPKPPHYRVHLSKAERRGKSYAELQGLREERYRA